MGFWSILGPAAIAVLIMVPVHTLFGVHIVRRGLIFIDLAVAQVAALGMSLAIAMGHEAASTVAYEYSVVFALLGALLISLSRFRLGKVPHEAIIGIVYVLTTAASIIVLEFDPSGHGHEELKEILTGNIMFVKSSQHLGFLATFGSIFAVLLLLWRPISALTLSKKESVSFKGVLLDFAFYALLGFMVASSVKVAGVLLVFTWLVMPAVIAFFFVERIGVAAALAIPLGVLGSFGGLLISYFAPDLRFQGVGMGEAAGTGNWPTGPSVVVALGALVVAAYLVRLFLPDRSSGEDVVLDSAEEKPELA